MDELGRHITSGWGLDEKIAACELLGTGMKPKDVAPLFKVSVQAIYDLKKKDRARAIIQQSAFSLIEQIPSIAKRVKKDFATADKLSDFMAGGEGNPTNIRDEKNILKFMETQQKREDNLLRAANIVPSTGDTQITNVYNDHRKTVLSDGVRQALGPGLDTILGAVDAEVVDD